VRPESVEPWGSGERFKAESARMVVVVDQDVDGANAVASEIMAS